MKRIATAAALALGVSLVAINGASAAPLTGELWLVTDAQAQDAMAAWSNIRGTMTAQDYLLNLMGTRQ